MTESAETFDDAPSPWWPCPECGGIEFRTVVLFERGEWISFGDDEDEGEYETFDPPDGRPGSVGTDVVCEQCGYRFDIHRHYGWPGSEES